VACYGLWSGVGRRLRPDHSITGSSPDGVAFSAVPVRSRSAVQTLAYRSGAATPAVDTRLVCAHIPCAGAGHSVRYCPGYGPVRHHCCMCSTAGAGVHHGAIPSGASSAACLLGGARPGAAWSSYVRLWSPGPILAEMGLGGGGGGGGGQLLRCPPSTRYWSSSEQLGGSLLNFWSWREQLLTGASGATSLLSPRLEPEAPLLVPPRPGHLSVFPTYSTILHSSLAEDRRLSQTLRSSAALEALDKTYQHSLLPIVNPVLAVQQLCQHGEYPRVVCTVASLCAGGWVSLLAAVLGRAFIPGAALLITLITIELSRRLGPQSSVRWALGILLNTDLGYDDGLLVSGGLAFRVESLPRREESAAAAVQSSKRGGCCQSACCCHHGERSEPAPPTRSTKSSQKHNPRYVR
jgi:hypothetical protein